MDDLSPIGLAIRELEWIELGRLDHDTLYPSYSQVLWNVRWNEDAMNLLQVSWQTSCGGLGDGGGVLDSQRGATHLTVLSLGSEVYVSTTKGTRWFIYFSLL